MIATLRQPERPVGAAGDLDDAYEDSAIVNARLAALVDSCDDAIVGKTLDGIITSWNAGAQRIFEYNQDEAIGQHTLRSSFPRSATPKKQKCLRACDAESESTISRRSDRPKTGTGSTSR